MSGPFGSTAWMANPASGFYGFEISNSLRFNDDDTAYLSFTPSSAGNLKTWSWSAWVKKSLNDDDQVLFSIAGVVNALIIDSAESNMGFDGTYGGTRALRYSTIKTRDLSAWYHVLYVLDTTQGTAANRLRLYVNGVEDVLATAQVNTYPAQDSDGGINTAVQHAIGRRDNTTSLYFDGYLAEINFIDGTALTPSSFGETKNDIWIPKDTSGLTFGTNGYRLQFKQTGTSQNSSGIGADTSGNDNHYAVNNLVASDVVPDSPTNNFCTWNPLDFIFNSNNNIANQTFSEGNTMLAMASASNGNTMGFRATMGFSSGKWYYEGRPTDALEGSDGGRFGFTGEDTVTVEDVAGFEMYWHPASGIRTNIGTTHTQRDATTYADDDILALALDLDANISYWYKNNSLVFTYDFTTHSADGVRVFHPFTYTASSGSPTWRMNWGADSSFAGAETAQGNADGNGIGDFYYTPRTNHLAMCTANMPDPVETIDPAQGGSPQDYFNTVLRDGTGSGGSITGVGFQPDWYWEKKRNASSNHYMVDSVRGVTKSIFPNLTNAEGTDTNSIQSFDTDGFTWGSDDRAADENLVVWLWKAGTAFSNDASATGVGSIDSAGSVSVDTGFSIISWTGTGSNGTIAHGLGVAPEMYIVKRRDAGGHSWAVYTATLGATKQLRLSGTNDEITTANIWNNTEPTSSVFSVGTNTDSNASSGTHIAYCFASVDGFSKIGSYTGNDNADGPFVYTGFRPAFVMIKDTTVAGSWIMYDSARDAINPAYKKLAANDTGAESTDSSIGHIDFFIKWL